MPHENEFRRAGTGYRPSMTTEDEHGDEDTAAVIHVVTGSH
ncbi:hypothetical protein ACWEGE_05270 [Amycolatopsis sp. NPDC004747]